MIGKNDQLAPPDLKTSLDEVEPSLATYVRSAEEIIALARNNKPAAHAMLPTFLASFSDLEDRLAIVSDHIEGFVDRKENRERPRQSMFTTDSEVTLCPRLSELAGLECSYSQWVIRHAIAQAPRSSASYLRYLHRP